MIPNYIIVILSLTSVVVIYQCCVAEDQSTDYLRDIRVLDELRPRFSAIGSGLSDTMWILGSKEAKPVTSSTVSLRSDIVS
jgi:hypothetical protein